MKSIHLLVRRNGMMWLTRNCKSKVQLNLFLFRLRFMEMENDPISTEMETK